MTSPKQSQIVLLASSPGSRTEGIIHQHSCCQDLRGRGGDEMVSLARVPAPYGSKDKARGPSSAVFLVMLCVPKTQVQILPKHGKAPLPSPRLSTLS